MPTPMPFADIITAGGTALGTLGLYGFIFAGLVVGLGLYIMRRAGAKTR